jgi:WD40 repeat protein/serine/threonine protein kinase
MTLDPFRTSVYSSILKFEPGHAVGNDYAIIELLGSGLTGITFKVTDLTGGEIFILKFITSDALYRDNRIKSFTHRLKKLAASPHSYIGEVRKVISTEYGFAATVSDIIPGEDLARRLGMNQEFDAAAAVRISREIAEGLAHAHSLGILHRNLRPSNVILTPGESVKIIDFCIPAASPSKTHPVAAYIAPEVLEMPERQDQKTDIFSLGTILEHLLTGAAPGTNRARIPAKLRGVIERATHPEPGERFDQVDEFIAELAAAAGPAGIPVDAANPGAPRVYIPDEDSQIRMKAVAAAGVKAPAKSKGSAPSSSIAPPKTVTRGPAKGVGSPAPKPSPPLPPPPVEEPTEEPVEEVLEEPLEEALEEAMEEPVEETIAAPDPTPVARPEASPAPAAAGSDQEIVLGADESGEARRFPLVLQGHKGYVHSVSVSPDGTYAASGASDSSIRIWKLADQSCETLPGHRGYVYSVAFGRVATRFYSVGMDGQLRSWNIENPQDTASVQAHSDRIFALAVDGTRMRAFTAGMDGKIRIWSLDSLESAGELAGHAERVYSMAVSRDGRLVASGCMDKQVKVWDVEAKKEVITLKGHKDRVYFALFTPDGKNVISASMDETINIWDLTKGKVEKTLKGHSGHVYTLALSNEGRYLVSGSMDKTIRVWEMPEGKLLATTKGHEGTVSAIALTPSARYLVSGSYDSTVRIWDFHALLSDREGE